MTKEEFAKWAAVLKTYYPRENLLPTKDAMRAWYAALGDITAEQAETALMRFVQTSVYPPTIAELRKLALPAADTWAEAWDEVIKSISKYGSYRVVEALDSLSPLARQAAQAVGYRDICMSENVDVIRGQFRSAYEAVSKRENELQQCSPEVRALLEKSTKLLGGN